MFIVAKPFDIISKVFVNRKMEEKREEYILVQTLKMKHVALTCYSNLPHMLLLSQW